MDNPPNRTLFFVKNKSLEHAPEIFQYAREQTDETIIIPESRLATMPEEGWREFYRHLEQSYPKGYRAMTSDFADKPVAFAIPTGIQVIEKVKRLAGPTRFEDNPPWTIRGRWGPYELPNTIVHASDLDGVQRDLEIFAKYTGLEI